MAKVALKHIQGNSYYIDGIFAVGVYRYGNEVLLIDSGSDDQSAKIVLSRMFARPIISR